MDRLSRVVVTAAFVLSAALASAQTPFRHSGAESKHSAYSLLPGEHIDPASGSLSLVATDLVLPGNAGFDLRVTRVYSSNIYPNYDSGNTDIEEDSWAGIGWRLHFGRVRNPDATTGGETVIEFGDGSQQPLYTTTVYPEGWMTAGFARYDRTNHTLKLPNGHVYTFGHVADLGGTIGIVRYVTEIRDPFNNKIEFSYFSDPGPRDGVSQIRQYLSPTQIRYVDFEYDPNGNTLKKMTYGTRQWNYIHDLVGGTGLSVLRHVKPSILQWGDYYDYSGTMLGELTRYWTHNGGWADYSYQDAFRHASTLTNRTRVVSQRTTGGRLINGGTWTFQYGVGTNEDSTVVSCPCGVTRYRFNGVGLTGDFSGWKSGTLAEQTIEKANGTVLERHEYTWVRSEPISPDDVDGEGGVWSDDAVYRALLQSVTVTRGTQSWTTAHEYHTENFNDFGQPWKTIETGEFTRTTERVFQAGFTPHILGRLATASLRVGSEIAPANWEYDLATGFATNAWGWGTVAVQVTPRADGNPESARDGRNNVTTFENYTWGKPQIVRTPKVRTDFTINADGSIATSTGAVTVTYAYDELFRLGQITSPGVNNVTNSYENFTGTGYTTTRGTSGPSVTTLLDGFGRVAQSSASSGVKARTDYDGCGRPTFVSMPYTTGTGSLGTTTQYDELGRVVSVTAPGGALTQYAYSGIDVTVTDAESHATLYDYSAAGSPGAPRLISVRDATNTLTTYSYDVLDNLTRVTGPGAVPDRVWVFDSNGNLMSETQPESGTTTYDPPDAAGNVTGKTNAENQHILFEYDENNRLKKFVTPSTAEDVTIEYDTHGRLKKQFTVTDSVTFTYNEAGQLWKREDSVVGVALPFISVYTYDLNENLTKITYPSGREVTYEYDVHDRLIVVRQKPPGGSSVVFADQFQYDGAGRLASYRTGTVTHTVEYDNDGRTHRLTTGSLLDLTYTYDGVGNVKTIQEPGQTNQAFGYDALNRLTSASGSWGQRAWTYHPNGDRATETAGGVTGYSYDSNTKRLMSTNGMRVEGFGYNNIGQLTLDGRGTYTYDFSGLVKTFTGLNVDAAYSYDPSGLRIKKTVNGVTTYTVRSSGGSVLSEYRAACGASVWTRDVIYAGGRLLGAIKATSALPTVTLTSSAVTVAEAGGTVAVSVQLATPGGTPLSCPVTVSYAGIPGSASGADFRVAAGSIKFAAGTANGATQTVYAEILTDSLDENSEVFSVALSGVTNGQAGTVTATTVTITDDDTEPSLQIADASASEGGAALLLNVSLSAASGRTVTVNYITASATATAGSDFTSGSGMVTFEPGEVTKSISVALVPDTTDEANEYFNVQLSSPVAATIAAGQARGTIIDDDGAGNDDFNGDGWPDLVWRNLAASTAQHSEAGQNRVWMMANRALEASVALPAAPDQNWEMRGVADMNGDDKPDLLWQNRTTGQVSAWLLDGTTLTGVVATSPAPEPISNWLIMAVADMNSDGHADLIWQNLATGELRVWHMNGMTQTDSVTLAYSVTPSTGWQIAGAGDLNGDGHPDLLFRSYSGTDASGFSTWLMSDTTVLQTLWMSPASVDPLWRLVAVADMDRNGKTDFVWQHVTNGQLAVWYMDGLTVTLTLYLDNSPIPAADRPYWRIVGGK